MTKKQTKNRLIKLLSLMLAVIVAAFSLVPMASAAIAYPAGITNAQSKEAMLKLDVLLISLLNGTDQGNVENIVIPSVCNDSTMSSLTKEIYIMMSGNAETLSTIGMNVSPSAVAPYFAAYPDVQGRLSVSADWNSVNLDGAVWGISDENSFTAAAVAAISPFNELLYTILCGGSYSLNSLIGITGAKGYENAVTGIYQNLGMKSYTAAETFYTDAASDRSSMVRHIVTDILTFVKLICTAPATRLSSVLPGIAYFIQNGGLDSAITTLVDPIKLNILGITTPFQVGSAMDLVGESQSGMSVSLSLGDLITVENFKTAPFDMATLASCGAVSETGFAADLGDSFMYLLRWMTETLKLNSDKLPEMLSKLAPDLASQELTAALSSLAAKGTDELCALIINTLTAKQGVKNPYVWSFPAQNTVQVEYTQNLGKDKYKRVLDGIDDLLTEFVKEGGTAKSIGAAIAPMIYSNKLVSELVVGIYSAFEKEELKDVLDLAGVYTSPSALAQLLTEDEYYGTAQVLYSYDKFSEIPADTMTWGFTDGDKLGFANALSAAFRPLDGVLRMLLCEGEITLMGAVSFFGSDGYNTAVIPFLEALGCPFDKIPTYSQFLEQAKDTDVMRPIVVTVVRLIEKILASPVKTVTEILPNLMYFLNNGGIKIAVENLLYRITKMLGDFGLSSMLDLSEITSLDYKQLVSSVTGSLNLDITLPELDLSQFASMGSLMTVQTKRTQAGQGINISYVQADQTAVLITLLRYLVEVIKLPGNESILDSFMNTSAEGGNEMFATFSKGIGDELAKMNTDETVEWLYKLFFRERAVSAAVSGQDYMPTIVYDESMPFKISGKTLSLIILALGIFMMFAIINRERIIPYLLSLKDRVRKRPAGAGKNKQEV